MSVAPSKATESAGKRGNFWAAGMDSDEIVATEESEALLVGAKRQKLILNREKADRKIWLILKRDQRCNEKTILNRKRYCDLGAGF